ncbi:hypothetical protein TNCV_4745361 [Trichonephila clavipes]|nr:hypothetical protein TNCV_4745361 [Trichonephila clavipes]
MTPDLASVSRPQTVLLQSLPWPPSDQYMAITGTKAEHAFIRKHNISSSNELWLDTTGVANGNGLESVEYTLVVLEVTDF